MRAERNELLYTYNRNELVFTLERTGSSVTHVLPTSASREDQRCVRTAITPRSTARSKFPARYERTRSAEVFYKRTPHNVERELRFKFVIHADGEERMGAAIVATLRAVTRRSSAHVPRRTT